MAFFAASLFVPLPRKTQTASDLYRINNGVTHSQTDFRQILKSVSPGALPEIKT